MTVEVTFSGRYQQMPALNVRKTGEDPIILENGDSHTVTAAQQGLTYFDPTSDHRVDIAESSVEADPTKGVRAITDRHFTRFLREGDVIKVGALS